MRILSWWFVSEVDEPGRQEDEEQDDRHHDVIVKAAALVGPPDVALDRLEHLFSPPRRRGRRGQRVRKTVHYALNPLFQHRDVEIDKQSGREFQYTQVRQQLRFVDR